ncbi:hypothetical protein LSH36_779g02005 [Paralvinella palmiformis]|uniref:PDZ domain-containing protein n=1 Tax=Paralvinella palmiformis TaxID=53620 RepID=A0AAD9J0S1_9ANNE|nr:hypothetical protein LSH36_779g02005 [Paralvinella palmiformis]
MSSTIPDDAPRPRQCNIKKWQGFNGYGFNLHAEKGKAGQYIGKVDQHSPADLAGLKEGDRIVEVNGTNISNENHQQVVQRIKANPNETRLLVVDHETDEYYKEKKMVIRSDLPTVLVGESPDKNPADDNDEMLNSVDQHSTHSSHSDNAVINSDHPYKVRLCHLRIWSDFQGYGFNLHAEKNKTGQYIGKVDEGSPAEAAGLQEKDRILEVNGLSVVNDNHQAAVLKIKSIPNETKLLVVDPEADEYFREKGISLNGQVPFILHLVTPERKSSGDTNNLSEDDHPHKPRLIQLETWPDYNGYGFNMQSIKGKPGEYIGKVEQGSPAYVAGLKEGDRIIEVGGSNVENQSHNDVVSKIKAASGRALLLVIDADADRYYKGKGIVVNSDMPNVVRLNCPTGKPQANGVSDLSPQENEVELDVPNGMADHDEPDDEIVVHQHADMETAPTSATKDEVTLEGEQVADSIIESAMEAERSMEDLSQQDAPHESYEYDADEPDDVHDYERVDSAPSPSGDNNNDEKETAMIEEEDEQQQPNNNTNVGDGDVGQEEEEAVIRAPTPQQEPPPPSYVESQFHSDVQTRQEVAEMSTPSSPDSQKSPVTIAGIEFAPSAVEARKRMSGRKKDVRHSQNLSAKEKYDLFQRL